MRLLRLVLLACLVLSIVGCASLADRIVHPQPAVEIDASRRDVATVMRLTGTTSESMHTPAGVKLHWYRVPAATFGYHYRYFRNDTSFGFQSGFDGEVPYEPIKPRGTIIYLHGWELNAASMLPWAWTLANKGYKGIALDLRNFGRSGKAPVGFGPREAGDVAALVDELEARDELVRPLYLLGMSYGGSTALFAEPALRGRLAGIVALEPFKNAAAAIRHIVAQTLKGNDGFSGWLTRLWIGWRYDEPEEMDRTLAEIDRRLDLDLAAIDASNVLARSRTCTLLLHGAKDRFIPTSAMQALADVNPRVRYLDLPRENHLTLPMRVGWLAQPIADWMAAVADGRCPALQLPKDPVAENGSTQ